MGINHAISISAGLLLAGCSGTQEAGEHHAPVAVAYGFTCTPRDARVIIDEIDQGRCLLFEQRFIGLPAGTHRLRVEREGYLPFERDLPSTGQRERLQIQLRERPE